VPVIEPRRQGFQEFMMMQVSNDSPAVSAYLAHPVTESIDFELLMFLRIPSVEASPLLPPDLRVLEIAPDAAVLAVGVQRITSTSFSACRDVEKIYLGVGVQPRYDLGTATPRFALYLPRMYANQAEFNRQLSEINRVAVHDGEGLRIRYGREDGSVRAEDRDGPIFHLQLSTPKPVFRKAQVWTQCHTLVSGARCIQAAYWTGEAYEHAGSSEVGEIHAEHPLFEGLPARGAAGRAYHQMFMKPASCGLMTLYQPVVQ
jgi:hypothetical protein